MQQTQHVVLAAGSIVQLRLYSGLKGRLIQAALRGVCLLMQCGILQVHFRHFGWGLVLLLRVSTLDGLAATINKARSVETEERVGARGD